MTPYYELIATKLYIVWTVTFMPLHPECTVFSVNRTQLSTENSLTLVQKYPGVLGAASKDKISTICQIQYI